MDNIVQKINNGNILSFDEVKKLFYAILKGEVSEAVMGSCLVAMKLRGETAEEIAAAATVLNEYKVTFPHKGSNTIDTCGTGGDGKSTLNVSTAVSLVLSAMGINVLKHGNVALSGKVGSADILEALGIPTKLDVGSSLSYFNEHDFIFLFAPHYHPAMKNVAKVRKDLKVSTIFNFLGPMINPGNPDYQAIGINRVDKLDIYAEAMLIQGRDNVMIYSSSDGYDEISSAAITHVKHLKNGRIETFEIDPADFFTPFPMPVVHSRDEATKIFIDAISGKDDNLAKLVAINTAACLYTMGACTLKEGFLKALNVINEGAVSAKIEELVMQEAV